MRPLFALVLLLEIICLVRARQVCAGINAGAGLCQAQSTMKIYALAGTDLSTLKKETLCSVLDQYKTCMGDKLKGCDAKSTVSFDMFADFLGYICLQNGYKRLKNTLPCFAGRSVFQDIELCLVMEAGNKRCGVADVYKQCIAKYASEKCPATSLADIDALVDVYLEPFKAVYCKEPHITPSPATAIPTIKPTTPTPEPSTVVPTTLPPTTKAQTTPQPTFQCYACKSGAPGSYQNRQCPASGRLYGSARQTQACQGRCVSIIKRFPKGDVMRGCSAGYGYKNVEIPRNGCVKYKRNLHCFCEGNKCNDQDMREQLEEFMKSN